MIETISTWRSVRLRHEAAPLLKEREKYLMHLLQQGFSRIKGRATAAYLTHRGFPGEQRRGRWVSLALLSPNVRHCGASSRMRKSEVGVLRISLLASVVRELRHVTRNDKEQRGPTFEDSQSLPVDRLPVSFALKPFSCSWRFMCCEAAS